MTADPYEASAGAEDPGSWNRYAYVQGDPVNRVDPTGLYYEMPDPSAPWIFSDEPGFGDPFAGLGSSDFFPGKSRRFACLNVYCVLTDGSCVVRGQRFAAGSAMCMTTIALDKISVFDYLNKPQSKWQSIYDDCMSLLMKTIDGNRDRQFAEIDAKVRNDAAIATWKAAGAASLAGNPWFTAAVALAAYSIERGNLEIKAALDKDAYTHNTYEPAVKQAQQDCARQADAYGRP